jgi:hypothetical protein
MDRVQVMRDDLKNRVNNDDILKKIYFSAPTFAFEDDCQKQYEIINEISRCLGIPYYNIHVTGSAKLGVSLHKKKAFNKVSSDLDVAIIDRDLFVKLSENIYKETYSFTNMSNFGRDRDGGSHGDKYKTYLQKGIVMTQYMPTGETKKEWDKIFIGLSTKHHKDFKSISGVVYLSQAYFINKQRSILRLVNDFEVK